MKDQESNPRPPPPHPAARDQYMGGGGALPSCSHIEGMGEADLRFAKLLGCLSEIQDVINYLKVTSILFVALSRGDGDCSDSHEDAIVTFISQHTAEHPRSSDLRLRIHWTNSWACSVCMGPPGAFDDSCQATGTPDGCTVIPGGC